MARWHIYPSGDMSDPHSTLHQRAAGPVTEISFGPAPSPLVLDLRALSEFDDLIGVLVSARAEHGQARARHEARPLVALSQGDAGPAWAAPVIELSPDVPGDLLAIPANRISDGEPSGLPHRGPLEAAIGEPTCNARDGNWACTASPHGAGDHAAYGADGSVARQWAREPAADEVTS